MSSHHLRGWKERTAIKINREHIQAPSIKSSDIHLVVYVGTQILWCSTWFCDGAIFKPGEIEITKDHFVMIILCVVHQILQLKNKETKEIILAMKLQHPLSQ